MECEQLRHDLAAAILSNDGQPVAADGAAHLECCAECRYLYEELVETAYLLSVMEQGGFLPGSIDDVLPGPPARSAWHGAPMRPPHAGLCGKTHRRRARTACRGVR